jgi:hypothetical protein
MMAPIEPDRLPVRSVKVNGWFKQAGYQFSGF